MMKHECNVARDLMPLALDGAASDESRKLLDEHLEECAACREFYRGMRAALPAAPAANGERERKAFGEAARKLRKKRRFRLWRNIMIGILAGVLATVGFLWAWTRLTQEFSKLVYHGEYNVFLSQLADGRVSVNMDYQGSCRYMAVCVEEHQEDGEKILYVYVKTTQLPRDMAQPLRNYSCMRLSAGELDGIAEIREGVPDEYVVVWQAGDAVSAASAEMETYFSLLDRITAVRFARTDDGKMYAVTYEESRLLEELHEQLARAEQNVPEWQ